MCTSLEDVERLNPPPAQVYALQAENRKRTDEVRELQKVGAAAAGGGRECELITESIGGIGQQKKKE